MNGRKCNKQQYGGMRFAYRHLVKSLHHCCCQAPVPIETVSVLKLMLWTGQST